MRRRRFSTKLMQSCCDRLAEDDGVDPRTIFRKPTGKVLNRKALQLCGQVARTLGVVLGECGDEVLRNLTVAAVDPAPDSSRLLVTVYSLEGSTDQEAVVERLGRAYGLLRGEVAAAIHRRKVPELTFRIVNPEK